MARGKTPRPDEGVRRGQAEKSASPAELARVIRHEVNNPLTGILGNAELILADGAGLPEKTRERLATIVYLAVRLRDVLRGLEEHLRDPGDPAGASLPSGQGRAAPVARQNLP